MKLDQEQLDTITELVNKAQHEFVKSDDFTGAITKATNSAASDAATTIVNKAITSKLKSFGNSLESKMAELIKEAVPARQDDDPPGDDPPPGGTTEETIRKSKPFRELQKSHDNIVKQMEASTAEGEVIKTTAFHKERDADLKTLATTLRAVEPEVIVDALRNRVTRDDSGDLVVVVNQGKDDETVQTTEEHVTAYLKARPFLVKASDGGGAGSGEGTGGGAGGGGGEEIKPEDLKDPRTYARLRAEGKIPGVKPSAQTGS